LGFSSLKIEVDSINPPVEECKTFVKFASGKLKMDGSLVNSLLLAAFGAAFGAVLGVIGKVVYDRRFAKRPDLRYSLGAPATFGTGERERTYQNLEVTNAGLETTTDVRINLREWFSTL
jgi:hypothetical protein